MRPFISLLLATVVWLASPVRAAEPGDSIRAMILDQLQAFQAQDLDRAFGHASPTIQQKFGSPDRFGAMVESGYPMVWAPQRFEVGTLDDRGGRTIQTMLFEDAQGRLFEADYEMRLIDGVWRINGVSLRQLPGLSS